MKVCLIIGQRIALDCTGLGKALLAHRSEPFVRSAIGPDPLRAFTDKTLRTGGDLLEDLAETRRRGYAVDDEEHFYGIVCVAAPAFNAKGETIAALSVAVTRVGRDPHNIDVARLGEVVREAAEGLSNTLGGQPPWRSF